MPAQKPSLDLSFTKQLLFSVILICSVFGAAEGAIRVWAHYFRTSYERYNSAAGRLELVPNIRHTARDGSEFLINSRGFVGPEFTTRPEEGVYRIIAIGDSCTFSEGLWRLAYPGLLQELLTARSRGRFEVLNAGIEGYNSKFALDRVREEIVDYRPRLVTIYIGWNDLMKTDPANLAATGRYATAARLMENSYLIKAYRKVMFAYMRPLLFRPRVGGDEGDAHAYDTFVPLTYRENLETMIGVLRANGIQAALFTLPTVVGPDMTGDELRRQNVFFPHFAGTYSVGKFLSLHRAYNDVIRKVGQELDVPVVDLDETFNAHDKSDLFWDTMHPSRKGQHLVAETVYRRLALDANPAVESSPK
jgi:lysophospholipase L1-like esterase